MSETSSSAAERAFKLVLEYDGRAFHGWQVQRRADGGRGAAADGAPRTVQGELIAALERLLRQSIDLVGASRTDRGVHALGQVASFRAATALGARNVLGGVNRYLPEDVAVRDVREVDGDFHARHSARGKHYRYLFYRSSVRSVFSSAWSSRCAGSLDCDAMREGAASLLGEHDFSAFETSSKSAPECKVRTIHSVEVSESGPVVAIDVLGRSFLYNMVRTIAGTLLEVGRGRFDPGAVGEILASRDRRRAGPTAEPQGLFLVEVFYDEEALLGAVDQLRDDPWSRVPLTGCR